MTAVEVEAAVSITLASIYIAHDQPALPKEVRGLVLERKKNRILQLGCDANEIDALW